MKKLISTLVFSSAAMGAMAAGTHVVEKGDTLYGISTRYHVSVESLRSANGLNGPHIVVGQKLSIPGNINGNAQSVSPAQKVVKQEAQSSIHVVRQGETLSGIADAYGIGLTTLARYNGMSTRKVLRVGQRLSIPSSRYNVANSIQSIGKHPVNLQSMSALVVDVETGKVIYSKNEDQVRPIASITKLMTAMVVLDTNLPMDEKLVISNQDYDHIKHTASRLPAGTVLSRYELMRLALMSSENRAASALSRYYPGGQQAFVAAMNKKAEALGMADTHFYDPTGLTPRNVSTASDLAKMVEAASQYKLIHKFTTTEGKQVAIRPKSKPLKFLNTNVLVRKGSWDIQVSKTGYINEAGRCLVMKADVGERPSLLILLDSDGKYSPVGDANRIKKWIESGRAGVALVSL